MTAGPASAAAGFLFAVVEERETAVNTVNLISPNLADILFNLFW